MPAGRPPKQITYSYAEFNGNEYIIGAVNFKDSIIKFVCNKEDETLVRSKHWHVVTGNYIGYNYLDPETDKKKVAYLHNLIMGRTEFNGKGQQETVDHINGIGFDNRRENLREISQSMQNRNTRNRERKTDRLPPDIPASDIPRNIWYMPAHEHHGDRFVVEFKGIPGVDNVEIKTTSSKSVSTRDKLLEAIRIRDEYLEKHPCLVEFSRMSETSERLRNEYHEICNVPTSAA
jgi:hypothetical protein